MRPDPHRDPVGPFLHYLMAECGLSPNTLAAYRSDIIRFGRWRKQHAPGPLADIEIGTLTGYVDYLNGCWPRAASGGTWRRSRRSTGS
jgi:integrase/recombinase XerD